MAKNAKVQDYRLDRLLASSGLGSRKEVKALVKSGRLTLHGEHLQDPGIKLTREDCEALLLDGRPLDIRLTVYLMMNKEAGKVTAMEDPSLPTVAEDLPEKWLNKGLAPCGRLDRDSTGLLIFTNDGQLNHRLSSPKHELVKRYLLHYEGPRPAARELEKIRRGIKLEDGTQCKPAELILPGLPGGGELPSEDSAYMDISEGKFHQVKRMMAAIGCEVTRLHRLSVGPLHLDEHLGFGETRLLEDEEIEKLYKAARLTRPEL